MARYHVTGDQKFASLFHAGQHELPEDPVLYLIFTTKVRSLPLPHASNVPIHFEDNGIKWAFSCILFDHQCAIRFCDGVTSKRRRTFPLAGGWLAAGTGEG